MMSGRRKNLKQEKRPMGAFLLSWILCLLALRLAGLQSLQTRQTCKLLPEIQAIKNPHSAGLFFISSS